MNLLNLDTSALLAINSLAKLYPFDAFFKLIVNEYFVPVLLSLALLFFWVIPPKRNKEVVLLSAISVGIVDLLIKIVNLSFFRARPFVHHAVTLLYYKPTDSSFPANSAAVAFAIAYSVWLYNRRVGNVLLVIAALYALSRVAVGVHYPSDVLAGAILGIGVSSVVYLFRPWLKRLTELLLKILSFLGLEPLY